MPAYESELFEREHELQSIARFLERVRARRGGLLVLDGPPGIGKTALLRCSYERVAAQGWRVLVAEARELGGQSAFACAGQLLHGRWSFDPDPGGGFATSIQRAVAVVLDLAEHRPVAVVLDDAQWADAASLRWLALLERSIASSPVAIMVTVRSADTLAPAVLAELVGASRTTVVRPAPLTEAGTASLLHERLGDALAPELVRASHVDTAGNPFLLVTLVEALRQAGLPQGSDAVRSVREIGSRAVSLTVRYRLERLEADPLRLIRATVLLGGVAGPAELAAIAGLAPDAGLDAAEALVKADLLRSAASLDLTHPLVGEAIRATIGAEERERIARTAIDLLIARGATEAAATIALELPPRAEPAIAKLLLDAARLARDRGAPDVAATLLRRARAEPPEGELRGAVLAALGTALMAIGDPEAIPVLRQALAAPTTAAETAERAARLALCLVYGREFAEAIEVLDRAAARLESAATGAAEELRAQALQYTAFEPALRDERVRRLAQLSDRPGDSDLAYRMRLAELANDSLTNCRPASETSVLAEQALMGGVLLAGSLSLHAAATMTLIYSGEPVLAEVHIRDAIGRCRRLGDLPQLGVQFGFRAEARRLTGDMIAVENDVRTAREWLPAGELGPLILVGALLESLVEQDQLDAAEAELHAAGMAGPMPEMISATGQLYARGRLRLATGAVRLGLDDLLKAGALQERFGHREPQTVPWRVAAAPVLLQLGDRDGALALSTTQLALAREFGAPHALGVALRLHGVITGGEDGLALLRQAVEVLEGSFARLELARALIDCGVAVNAAGSPAPALELLKRGAELAEALGGVAVARRACEELVHAGGRPRRPRRRGWSGLTAAEQRVARLAAEGMTNREVAETLVVSQKTVESQLRSVFRKLGVSSRGELAGMGGVDGVTAGGGSST